MAASEGVPVILTDDEIQLPKFLDDDKAVLAGVALNILSGVGVVLLNKYIYTVDGFKFMVTLSAIHFLTTWAATRALAWCNYFDPKVPEGGLKAVLPVALGSLGSVCFMNLNLAHNSVPTYQITKLACVPVMAIVQRSLYNTGLPQELRAAIVLILLGVVLGVLTDAQLNLTGVAFAVASIAATVGSQVLTNKRQKDLKLNHMQLLYHASPIIAVGFCFLAPMFDSMESLGAFMSGDSLQAGRRLLTASKLLRIFISGFLALVVNVSNEAVVEKKSPLSVPFVGHVKAVLLLLVSAWLFGYALTFKNVASVTLVVVGVIWFSELRRKQQARRLAAAQNAVQPRLSGVAAPPPARTLAPTQAPAPQASAK